MKRKKSHNKSYIRTYEKTFDAKVDIVSYPDNIKNYSEERNDYTELAITAIKQKPSVIGYISPTCKGYAVICEEAVDQDIETFLRIDDNVSNYKQLGIKAIVSYPNIVARLNKDKKFYFFFWELAISMCYKTICCINERKKELFPLLEKIINQEPLAIAYVDSDISIYKKLCEIAYSKNKDSVKYMDINCVENYLVLEMVKKAPEKIKQLKYNKDCYNEAWNIALSINGKLIEYYKYPTDSNLDNFFEIIKLSEKTAPEIANYSIVLYALCLDNRKRKEKILNTPNVIGNNIYKLSKEIDDEYKSLVEEYKSLVEEYERVRVKEREELIYRRSSNNECPVKVKKYK